MKPRLKKSLLEIAEKLPVKWTPVGFEPHPISAEDLLLCNREALEGYSYTIDVPIHHKVNHFERLKKELQKSGVSGVRKYVQSQML